MVHTIGLERRVYTPFFPSIADAAPDANGTFGDRAEALENGAYGNPIRFTNIKIPIPLLLGGRVLSPTESGGECC